MTEMSSRGTPNKIDEKYLESVGYTNSTDKRIISILKFINLLNRDGTTNENYETFRDASKAGALMNKVIITAYADIYKVFPDAHLRDNKTLINWFKTNMGVGVRTARYTVSTFKLLCGFADFTSVEKVEKDKEEKEDKKEEEALKKADIIRIEEKEPGIVINVNIQLALPATENVDVYDKIFKSLKENILKRED